MSNEYNGPSFNNRNQNNESKNSGFETKAGSFEQPYVPPVMQRSEFKAKTNFRLIEKKLYKRPDDYYIVVDEETDFEPNLTPERQEEQPIVKETVKRANKHALGHSLSDILETENQAQKQLKIFKESH